MFPSGFATLSPVIQLGKCKYATSFPSLYIPIGTKSSPLAAKSS